MKPTTEQQTIIDIALESKNIAIEAGAGCAKSQSLKFISETLPNKNILYVVFNKENAEEAKGKFPPNVECRTINSLAYKEIVKYPSSSWGKRLDNLNLDDIKVPEDVKPDDVIIWKLFIRRAVTEYMQSGEIGINQFLAEEYTNLSNLFVDFTTALEQEELELEQVDGFFNACQDYWIELAAENSKVSISHDVYLKLYQLSKPFLFYDIIMVDEFQDSNPVMLDIVLSQKHTQTIVVGDPHQSIYAFRGAVNGFDFIPDNYVKLSLTSSYRYTQEIANLGVKALNLKGTSFPLQGLRQYSEAPTRAIVCRTNIGVLECIVSAIQDGLKVYSNVNLKPVFAALYHIEAIWSGKEPKFPSREISFIKTYNDLSKYGSFVPEVNAYLNVFQFIRLNGYNVYGFKLEIDKTLTTKDKADYSIITCHKAKGMEYGSVTIHKDFIPKIREDGDVKDHYLANIQEANLLYIAITRGMSEVFLPEDLEEILC